MANTNKPYRRIGTNSWKELLDKVNDKLQNPESGCDPIDPIEVPDPPHRWAKSDVREVHDKLDEMPGNCFTWGDIPDLWKISIIEEIEDQLDNAWCECKKCTWQCDNARNDLERIDLLTVATDADDCTTCGITTAENDNCQAIRNTQYTPTILEYFDAKDRYNDNFIKACDLEDEIADLEDEIDRLEEQRDIACATPGQEALCQSLNDQIQAKEDELADKQTELAEAESKRDTARGEVLSKGTQAFNVAVGTMGKCNATVLTLVSSGPLPTNIKCGSGQGELGSDCPGTVSDDRNVFRCHITWALQQRYTYYLGTCSGSVFGPFGGSWVTINNGVYNLDGSPVLTSWGPSYGCQREIHHATCFSNTCNPICGGDSGPGCTPGSSGTMDYRITRNYPNEFPYNPVDCDGNPCDEGGGGGGE